jgi:hypothetical protein
VVALGQVSGPEEQSESCTPPLQRVFDRFVRLDASREQHSGSAGLGLAIAKAIVVAHRGTIAVAEADGGGASVVVGLPAFGEPEADRRPTTLAPPGGAAAPGTLGGPASR